MRKRRKQQLFDECKRQVDALLAEVSRKFAAIMESPSDQALVNFGAVLEASLDEAKAIAQRVQARITENDETRAMKAAVEEAQRRIDRRRYAEKQCMLLHIGAPLDNWTSRAERLEAIRELENFYSDIVEEKGFNLATLRAEVGHAISEWLDPLLAEAATNHDAFMELFVFMTEGGLYPEKNHAKFYIRHGVDLDLSGWNEAVAIHREDPVLQDFVGIKHNLKPSEVLRLAVEAKLDNKLAAIKIVLAYCHIDKHAQAVGSLRQVLAEMAILIERASKR